MNGRKYTLRRRAVRQAETRRRIVEAAMALHEAIGPKETTVSGIAERAGVQRLTVYRHFPDEASLLQACSSGWFELNPPPDRSQWSDIEGPEERAHAALAALYAYYRQTQDMWRRLYKDVDDVEALRAAMDDFEAYLEAVAAGLLKAWHVKGAPRRALRAVLRHALRFSTWDSLAREGLSDTRIARLVAVWPGTIATSR